jgi:hypothetical protein
MNLPRIPLPDAIGSGSHYFEVKVYNTAITRLEQRLDQTPVPRFVSRVAELEQTMYAILSDSRATPLDKFEAVTRFAFAYESALHGYVAGFGQAPRHIGDDVLRELSLTL